VLELVSMLVRGFGAVLLLSVWGCSHSQTAPTPAPSGTTTTVTSSSSSSKTERPWTKAAPNPSPPSVADLTAPMDVAMVLCSSALNLAPCGVITTGATDTMTCFAGCQTQIESVVAMTIEHAARKCAASPPPEAGPRECALSFPPTAALDTEVAAKTCNSLCEELVAQESAR
jgi:hypothetical protein